MIKNYKKQIIQFYFRIRKTKKIGFGYNGKSKAMGTLSIKKEIESIVLL